MTDIEEALAALDAIDGGIGTEQYGPVRTAMAALGAVRRALESVAQERRDWADISAWLERHPLFDVREFYDDGFEEWHCLFSDADSEVIETGGDFTGSTRAEALSKAAAWARAEMGSKT
jgi:hypothetical protein